MGLARFLVTPVAISNPGALTSNQEGVPSTAATTVNTLAQVQPVGRDEEQILGVEEATRYRRVWLAKGTVVTHRSKLTIGGLVYDVAGDPHTWDAASTLDHVVLLARRVMP